MEPSHTRQSGHRAQFCVVPQSSTKEPHTIPSLAHVFAGTQAGAVVVVLVVVVVVLVVVVVVEVVVEVVVGGEVVGGLVVDVVVLVVVVVVVDVVVVVGQGSHCRVTPHSSTNEPQRPSQVCVDTQWQTPAGAALQVSG
ncbi:MAG: hypothetical protein IT335_11810, partial [Thermomicrobiales bacterium]|nr:hypothetical protein [Thermomicrobiales bacterium]